MALAAEVGIDLSSVSTGDLDSITWWFGEVTSTVVVAIDPASRESYLSEAERAGIPCVYLGTAGGDAITFPDGSTLTLSTLREASESALTVALETSELVSA
jgi:phosphoribosylformylglycinamidine synthase